MAKKGLITSLILGAVLTLSLGVYSLVTAIVAITTPAHTTLAYAYTSDQKITAFSNYSVNDGNLTLEYAEGQEELLMYNIEDNSYSVDLEKEEFIQAKVGDSFNVKAVATTDKHGSTTTYEITIYKQGLGTKEYPYVVANADGMDQLATKTKDDSNVVASIVEDIDLAGKDWKGLAQNYVKPFSGTISGNGHAVKNMNIHITADNYSEYLGSMEDADGSYTVLSVGFIRKAQDATINGLSVVDANITIDEDVFALINPEQNSTLDHVKVGILVADAKNVRIDGKYTTTTTTYKADVDPTTGETIQVPEETISEHSSVVSGTINGFSFGAKYDTRGYSINGIGAIVGALNDVLNGNSSSKASRIANYITNLDVTSINVEGSNIGGAIGEVYSYDADKLGNIKIENIDATLSSNARFNNVNSIGGLAGQIAYADVENVKTNATIKDTTTNPNVWANWLNSADRDYDVYTEVAGISARATYSTFKNVTSTADIDVYARTSAGFIYVEESTLENVITSGTVQGDTATGLAKWLYDSKVEYRAEDGDQAEDLVATNITLYGWNTAGLAEYVKDSDIKAYGSVKANVTINARGGIQDGSKNIQNVMVSSGLVGYFYTSNINNSRQSEYVLEGISAVVIINNTINGAGLVAYLGNDTNELTSNPKTTVAVLNCSVELTVKSKQDDDEGSRSVTYQVGGAVITIYGAAKLDDVRVNVNFNNVHDLSKKYGAAWFGGLVSRIGGKYVTINNCTTIGEAYINSTIYTKQFGDYPEYEQLIAGGFIGAIASFGQAINAGEHPIYGSNTLEIVETTTVDNVLGLDTSTLTIENNTSSVNITIDFVKAPLGAETASMRQEGYRARSAGTFIGLVMNGISSEGDGEYDTLTTLNLSSNKVSGKLDADGFTFRFLTKTDDAILSSIGYGKVAPVEEGEAKSIGSSYDLVSNETYTDAIKFPSVINSSTEESVA